jgi:hypothetical protein
MGPAPPLENDMRTAPLLLLLLALPVTAAAELYVTIIEGLGGTAGYATQFAAQTEAVTNAFTPLAGSQRIKTFSGEQATRAKILEHFKAQHSILKTDDRSALILIGHGSYDGREYKFNIPGPDLTGTDLGNILKDDRAKLQLLINLSSSSGAILKDLEKDQRVLITATRSGNERNAPRFGTFLTGALQNTAADTDKNGIVSAAEAFAYADRYTRDFYEAEGRLATEHPQLSGDKAGQFSLARLIPAPATAETPDLRDLLSQREALDRDIEELRLRKDDYANNDEFLDALQDLILKLSAVEERIEALEQEAGRGTKSD